MKVENGTSISLQYRLTYDDQEGELIEETSLEDPLEFTMGNEEMLDAFEKELIGKAVSDSFSFTLTPEKAFGEFQEALVVEYPKDNFLVDGELDEEYIREGEIIEMTDEEDNVLEGMIEENKLNSVIVNFNHPLAGETIHFKGVITNIS